MAIGHKITIKQCLATMGAGRCLDLSTNDIGTKDPLRLKGQPNSIHEAEPGSKIDLPCVPAFG